MRDKAICIEVQKHRDCQTDEQALLSACSLLNSNGYFVESEDAVLYETQRTIPISQQLNLSSSEKLATEFYATHVFGWKFRFDYYVDFMPHKSNRPLN